MLSKKNEPTLFVGVDFHKKRFVCSFFDNETGEIIQRNYDTTEIGYDEFSKAISGYRQTGKKVKVALEMLTGRYYFYDKMKDSCDEIVIINSNKFKLIAESSKKTDKIDSGTIAIYYSKDLLPTVYIPESSIRQLRDLVSLRYRFVKERSGYKNRIHSLLLKNGRMISKRSLSSKKKLEELQGLGLSKFYQRQLDLLINQLNRLTDDILEIEQMMDELIEEEAEDRVREDIELLKSIPGVGDLSAKILVSCIADVERFGEEKQLASYVGLVPRVRDSGEVIHHGRITRKGNKIARTTLVQDALAMLRQKNGPLKGFYNGIKYRAGTGKAIIALARKISTIMFVILKRRTGFDSSLYQDRRLVLKKVA